MATTTEHARIGLHGLLDLPSKPAPAGTDGSRRVPCLLVSFTHKRLMVVSATAHGPIAVDHNGTPTSG